ncbi:BstXI family restriction endonuclease [Halobacteriovorax sp. GFR7]|uniref:BstXI family restriction endonuclease n=1 Tax=unclassified Halobacteriovorax TaxID=2639665 RepID=UPI003D95CE4D
MTKPPKLPKLLETKIYKTGQTRGADDDVIFQNRVLRTSTVLIDYDSYQTILDSGQVFGKGFIVLIRPNIYFSEGVPQSLQELGLTLGENLLIFYYSRSDWNNFHPDDQSITMNVATSRTSPLGGQYVARVPATTSEGEGKINIGFNTSKMKGAGIRVYEYASSETINKCKLQLEYIFWSCFDSEAALIQYGMTQDDIDLRREFNREKCEEHNLIDHPRLVEQRIINEAGNTICPLCKEEISALGFFRKVLQAEGRAVDDLTVTELNLFHINELRVGEYNHKPYNLGWGHHHCNVVVKDAGIAQTIDWMADVLRRNDFQVE